MSYFLGEPNKLLNKKEGEAEGEEEPVQEEAPADEEEEGEGDANKKAKDSDESEEEEIKVPKRTLTELNRLAIVVNAIENDCHMCPVGSFKITPQHELRRDESFRGLDSHDGHML